MSIYLANMNTSNENSADKYRLLQKLNVYVMLKVLDETHMEISKTLSISRKQAIDLHNASTHVIPDKSVLKELYFLVTV